jgi:hypothetical protein
MKQNQTTNVRRGVTQRAASSDKQYPMRIVLILSLVEYQEWHPNIHNDIVG